MQESFDIRSSSGNYEVLVGSNLLASVMNQYPDAIYIVDQRLVQYLPESITKRVLVEATEANKSLERMPDVLLQLRELGANRTTYLVAIGGGVIQDIATFSASVYMRGISWTYMPTTLLGMADSCIGGKSSINMLGYKNLIGNFYPPKNVLIDTTFIKTLNADQVIGGLFEAAKICYARGYEDFLAYLEESPGYPIDPKKAGHIILRSLKTKKWFIEIDEFDQKERLLLNYGHTFGHAIEAGTNFGISHGVAVGIGMVVAVEYAKTLGNLSALGERHATHLIEHVKSMVGSGLAHVMQNPPLVDLSLVSEKFENDKKHRTDCYRVVVPQGDGDLALVSQARTAESQAQIRSAYVSGLKAIGYPRVEG